MSKRLLKYIPFFIIAIVIFAISYFRSFENYELATLDLRYKFRPAQPVNPDIVIVEIGDDSIEKIGRWPFDRDYHARLLDYLAYYGVKTVFFDVIFSEEEENDGGKSDKALVESSKKLDVYYPCAFNLTGNKTGPLAASGYATPLLENLKNVAKGTGHINAPLDSDGKIRKIPLLIKYNNDAYPANCFRMACDYLGISINDFKVPTDDRLSMLVNYPGKWKETFKHVSYVDIITSGYLESQGQKGSLDLRDLKDKICFVGLTATATHDIKAIPLENLYPGIGVQASAFNTLVTKNFIVRAPKETNLLIAFLLALIIAILSLRLRPIIGLALSSAITALFLLAAFSAFAFFRIWIDLFFPVVLMAFTYLYATYSKYSAERKKRELIEKELSIAKTIQQSFLPENLPELKGLEIAVSMLTARHVGGDLYDFLEYNNGMLGVMIGDVSGKGVPAALFMAKVVSELRVFSKEKRTTAEILKDLNVQLVNTSKANLFVTMAYLLVDAANKHLTFSSGGHLPTILVRGGNAETFLAKEGMALGLFESEYSEEKIEFLKGDLFLLYTDGVTEAINAKGEEFGMERLLELAKKYSSLSCKEILSKIQKDIKNFAGRMPQHDDITIIAMKVL